jgi:hypothetical protein
MPATTTIRTTTWASRHPLFLRLGPLVLLWLVLAIWLKVSDTTSSCSGDGSSRSRSVSNFYQVDSMRSAITDVETSPAFVMFKSQYQEQRQYLEQSTSIHTVVSFIVTITVLLLTIVYALMCVTNTSQRRKQLMDELLTMSCRIKISSTDWRVQSSSDESCPICLSSLLQGQIVLECKFCSCTKTKRSYHEKCLLPWLLEKRLNSKQLCPCCRQPFLQSGYIIIGDDEDDDDDDDHNGT